MNEPTIFGPEDLKADPTTVRYPDVEVQLTGEDGNIFNLLALVQTGLRRAKVPIADRERLMKQVTTCNSYDEALQTLQRWVTVT